MRNRANIERPMSYRCRHLPATIGAVTSRLYDLRAMGCGACFATPAAACHASAQRRRAPGSCSRISKIAIAVGWRSEGPNWSVLASLLQSGRIRDGRTGLAGVIEVLPGQSVDITGNQITHWSPRAFVDDVVEDRAVAKRMLREAIDRSVESVGRSHDRIMHLLSGGLDSSIVLASLRRTVDAQRIKCLTFTQGDASELDEVRFARLAAESCGVDLAVARFNASNVRLERAHDQIAQPRPLGYTFSIDNDDTELEFAQAFGATVCTSGAGGDGLFINCARGHIALTICCGTDLRWVQSVWPSTMRALRERQYGRVCGRVGGSCTAARRFA